MDLRRALAERFSDVAHDADPYLNPGALEWGEAVAIAIAEECIRQMRWARNEALQYAADDAEYDFEVTIAPPDFNA